MLDAGADDFVRASASRELLLARVRAALRRRVAPTAPLSRLALGDVLIDLQAHALFIAGTPVKCPPLQFVLLVVLAKRVNQVVEPATRCSPTCGAPSRTPSIRAGCGSPSACSVESSDPDRSDLASRPCRTWAIDSRSTDRPEAPRSRSQPLGMRGRGEIEPLPDAGGSADRHCGCGQSGQATESGSGDRGLPWFTSARPSSLAAGYQSWSVCVNMAHAGRTTPVPRNHRGHRRPAVVAG